MLAAFRPVGRMFNGFTANLKDDLADCPSLVDQPQSIGGCGKGEAGTEDWADKTRVAKLLSHRTTRAKTT